MIRTMMRFSRGNIEIIPQADCMLREISDIVPTYIVSTSYSPYIMAVCDAIGFPFQNTYSTAVSLDKYPLTDTEKKLLKELQRRILDLPDFSIPKEARSIEDLSEQDAKLSGNWMKFSGPSCLK